MFGNGRAWRMGIAWLLIQKIIIRLLPSHCKYIIEELYQTDQNITLLIYDGKLCVKLPPTQFSLHKSPYILLK